MNGKGGTSSGRRKITFAFEAPGAREVVLAGSFNDWSLKKHPMKRDGQGVWTRSVMLLPGSYEYKYYVDGQWCEDPCNERCCPNCFGGSNNVVKVCSKRSL